MCSCVTLSKSLQIVLSCRQARAAALPVDSPTPACQLTANGWRAPPVRPQVMQWKGQARLASQSQLQSCIIEDLFFFPAKSGSFALVKWLELIPKPPPITSCFFEFHYAPPQRQLFNVENTNMVKIGK